MASTVSTLTVEGHLQKKYSVGRGGLTFVMIDATRITNNSSLDIEFDVECDSNVTAIRDFDSLSTCSTTQDKVRINIGFMTEYFDPPSSRPRNPALQIGDYIQVKCMKNPSPKSNGGVVATAFSVLRASDVKHSNTEKPVTMDPKWNPAAYKEYRQTRILPELKEGELAPKSWRSACFAEYVVEWLAKVSKNVELKQQLSTFHVIDVAGGKGHVADALAETVAKQGQLQDALLCTTVDPWLRGPVYQRLSEKNLHNVRFVRDYFGVEFAETDIGRDVLSSVAAVIGMHPDQATEPIVDVAMMLHVPFIVVPCCVFPTENPHRRLESGSAVESTDEFIQYLKEKCKKQTKLSGKGEGTLVECSLNFVGKDRVLAWTPDGWPSFRGNVC